MEFVGYEMNDLLKSTMSKEALATAREKANAIIAQTEKKSVSASSFFNLKKVAVL